MAQFVDIAKGPLKSMINFEFFSSNSSNVKDGTDRDLMLGHETVGVVAAVGKDVKGFAVGERVVADNSELCNECFYCRRGQLLLCENVRDFRSKLIYNID